MEKEIYGAISKKGGTDKEVDEWIAKTHKTLSDMGFNDFMVCESIYDSSLVRLFFRMSEYQIQMLLNKGMNCVQLVKQDSEYYFFVGELNG